MSADFVAKSALFRPFDSAIVTARPSIVAPSPRDARSVVRTRRGARDRARARARPRDRCRRARDDDDDEGRTRGREGTPTTTRQESREDERDATADARAMVFGFGKRASALTAAIEAREAKARARTSRDGAEGDASASGRARDESRSERSGNYGSSSHGGHGREMMYDADAARTFGRQHGSTEVLSAMTTEEARTIPARAITVHAGEKSESYVRGADGELYEMMACGRTRTGARAPSSPRAVVTVHSSEVNEDAGSIGAAGRRYRGSFNSLLLLEAQELSTGRAPTASG